MGILAKLLHDRGHQVVWWAGTFDHRNKRHRAERDVVQEVAPGYTIRLIHGPAYRSNVSVRRLYNHRVVASRFHALALQSPPPDVILCCVPTLDLGEQATRYGHRLGRPVILDYRDLWPEIWVYLFPSWLRPALRLLLWPLYLQARRAFSRATSICGITERFVEAALKLGRRSRTGLDRAFPHGYVEPDFATDERGRALSFWMEQGVKLEAKSPIFCFFGHLSRRHEWATLLQGFKLCRETCPTAQLVICGHGDALSQCQSLAGADSGVFFPGWVGGAEIATLMQHSIAGLIPYPSTPDFEASYPNKAIEYLAGGLPVLSSVKGLLEELLRQEECGFTYENGNARQFANLAGRLCNEPDLVRACSVRARNLFEARFEAGKVYGEFIRYIETVATAEEAKKA